MSQTSTHFLCYCPFHSNHFDPAFAVDKEKGLFTCFNPSCGRSGKLDQLLRQRKALNPFQAARIILKYQISDDSGIDERIDDAWEDKPEFVQFPIEPVERMAAEFWLHTKPQEYMFNRHFTEDTLNHFDIGYSEKQDMTIVPVHEPSGMLVGFVGRSIEMKRFKNSDHLPKSKTMFNLHRAKKHGASVIVVESSFDAMRLHQAGYPNVVALLGGGGISPAHIKQLNRFFSTVTIMTDFDKKQFEKPGKCNKCRTYECAGHRPGRDLGRKIADQLPNKQVMWAAFNDECVYPYKPLEGYRETPAKDIGDMSDDEIRQCLKNAVTDYEYSVWEIEENILPWE